MTFLEHPLWRYLQPHAVEFGDATFFVDVPAELRALSLQHAVANCARCGKVINPVVEYGPQLAYVPVCDQDEGVAEVEDRSWLWEARATVLDVAGKLDSFSADDVWATGLAKPREPRALGYVMRELARSGFIEMTGDYHRTNQALRHRAPVMLWRRRAPRAA